MSEDLPGAVVRILELWDDPRFDHQAAVRLLDDIELRLLMAALLERRQWIWNDTRTNHPSDTHSKGQVHGTSGDMSQPNQHPTDHEIQERVRKLCGFALDAVWIAHCRYLCGVLPPAGVPEWRPGAEECPSEKIEPIVRSMRSLGVIF